MENAAIFRRHVQYHEWKHKILKFKMESMVEDINAINKCKVSVNKPEFRLYVILRQ